MSVMQAGVSRCSLHHAPSRWVWFFVHKLNMAQDHPKG